MVSQKDVDVVHTKLNGLIRQQDEFSKQLQDLRDKHSPALVERLTKILAEMKSQEEELLRKWEQVISGEIECVAVNSVAVPDSSSAEKLDSIAETLNSKTIEDEAIPDVSKSVTYFDSDSSGDEGKHQAKFLVDDGVSLKYQGNLKFLDYQEGDVSPSYDSNRILFDRGKKFDRFVFVDKYFKDFVSEPNSELGYCLFLLIVNSNEFLCASNDASYTRMLFDRGKVFVGIGMGLGCVRNSCKFWPVILVPGLLDEFSRKCVLDLILKLGNESDMLFKSLIVPEFDKDRDRSDGRKLFAKETKGNGILLFLVVVIAKTLVLMARMISSGEWSLKGGKVNYLLHIKKFPLLPSKICGSLMACLHCWNYLPFFNLCHSSSCNHMMSVYNFPLNPLFSSVKIIDCVGGEWYFGLREILTRMVGVQSILTAILIANGLRLVGLVRKEFQLLYTGSVDVGNVDWINEKFISVVCFDFSWCCEPVVPFENEVCKVIVATSRCKGKLSKRGLRGVESTPTRNGGKWSTSGNTGFPGSWLWQLVYAYQSKNHGKELSYSLTAAMWMMITREELKKLAPVCDDQLKVPKDTVIIMKRLAILNGGKSFAHEWLLEMLKGIVDDEVSGFSQMIAVLKLENGIHWLHVCSLVAIPVVPEGYYHLLPMSVFLYQLKKNYKGVELHRRRVEINGGHTIVDGILLDGLVAESKCYALSSQMCMGTVGKESKKTSDLESYRRKLYGSIVAGSMESLHIQLLQMWVITLKEFLTFIANLLPNSARASYIMHKFEGKLIFLEGKSQHSLFLMTSHQASVYIVDCRNETCYPLATLVFLRVICSFSRALFSPSILEDKDHLVKWAVQLWAIRWKVVMPNQKRTLGTGLWLSDIQVEWNQQVSISKVLWEVIWCTSSSSSVGSEGLGMAVFTSGVTAGSSFCNNFVDCRLLLVTQTMLVVYFLPRMMCWYFRSFTIQGAKMNLEGYIRWKLNGRMAESTQRLDKIPMASQFFFVLSLIRKAAVPTRMFQTGATTQKTSSPVILERDKLVSQLWGSLSQRYSWAKFLLTEVEVQGRQEEEEITLIITRNGVTPLVQLYQTKAPSSQEYAVTLDPVVAIPDCRRTVFRVAVSSGAYQTLSGADNGIACPRKTGTRMSDPLFGSEVRTTTKTLAPHIASSSHHQAIESVFFRDISTVNLSALNIFEDRVPVACKGEVQPRIMLTVEANGFILLWAWVLKFLKSIFLLYSRWRRKLATSMFYRVSSLHILEDKDDLKEWEFVMYEPFDTGGNQPFRAPVLVTSVIRHFTTNFFSYFSCSVRVARVVSNLIPYIPGRCLCKDNQKI